MKTPPTWEEELKDEVEEQIHVLLRMASLMQPKSDAEFVAVVMPNLYIAMNKFVASHEATIRQEIGEQLEEIRFHAHNGKDVYHKIVSLLAIINPTP